LVNDYWEDTERCAKWKELLFPIVFFLISNVESLGYTTAGSAMICKKLSEEMYQISKLSTLKRSQGLGI
jgi:hypothetical protein